MFLFEKQVLLDNFLGNISAKVPVNLGTRMSLHKNSLSDRRGLCLIFIFNVESGKGDMSDL